MTAQRGVLSWREWISAEWTILRSKFGSRRRSRLAAAAAQRMRTVIWAVSPRDGHRHAFSISHLTDVGFRSLTRARCSHPAPEGELDSAMLPTGPLCLTCVKMVGGLIADAALRQAAPRQTTQHSL